LPFFQKLGWCKKREKILAAGCFLFYYLQRFFKGTILKFWMNIENRKTFFLGGGEEKEMHKSFFLSKNKLYNFADLKKILFFQNGSSFWVFL